MQVILSSLCPQAIGGIDLTTNYFFFVIPMGQGVIPPYIPKLAGRFIEGSMLGRGCGDFPFMS